MRASRVLAGAALAFFLGGVARAADRAPQTVFRYLGVKWCRSCHSHQSPNPRLQVVHSWEDSAHAGAWEALPPEERDNPACLRCHTTGYGMPRRTDVSDA